MSLGRELLSVHLPPIYIYIYIYKGCVTEVMMMWTFLFKDGVGDCRRRLLHRCLWHTTEWRLCNSQPGQSQMLQTVSPYLVRTEMEERSMRIDEHVTCVKWSATFFMPNSQEKRIVTELIFSHGDSWCDVLLQMQLDFLLHVVEFCW